MPETILRADHLIGSSLTLSLQGLSLNASPPTRSGVAGTAIDAACRPIQLTNN
jgi:hypothetical protein